MNYTNFLSKDNLTIFLLHGVVKKNEYKIRNYIRKHIEAEYFQNVMKELKKYGTPISMDEVIYYHKNKKPFPPYSFAITFDDGFENNYSVAAPILEELEIPATFYISTDLVENNRMTWVDKIEYCFEYSSDVKFNFNDIDFHVRTVDEKINSLKYLRKIIKEDSSIDPNIVTNHILNQSNINIDNSNDPLDLKMNWKQVREIYNNKFFIVGGHCHNHVNMAYLNEDDLNFEVTTSIRLISENLNFSPIHYAYPEGLEYCFSDKVIDKLKMNGIQCCPTAIEGVNDIYSDLFHLKRIFII